MQKSLFGKVFGKIVLSFAIAVWAVVSLFPIKDRPFDTFIQSKVQVDKPEFSKIFARAKESVEKGKYQTVFVALKKMGEEEKIDYAKFFPQIPLADVKNIVRKNDILLNELLSLSKSRLKQGLDLQGGVSFTLALDPETIKEDNRFQRQSKMHQAIDVINRRINALGVTEPIIRAKGDHEIEVQLPGVSTQENPEIVSVLKKPAKLAFRLVHPTLQPGRIAKIMYPPGYEVLNLTREDKTGAIIEIPTFVKRLPEMTGKGVKSARVVINPYGGYEVSLTFTDHGTQAFAEITKKNLHRQLGIVLDGKLYSDPVIQSEITNGHASISGTFSQREAIELANVLNNPLEFELQLREMCEVGPSLASDARHSAINASILGAGAVIVFMIAYYAVPGVIAVVSVLLNILIVLGILIGIGATMTLPGVAALVLTVGMGVDSNILIFERMKEELKLGKSLPAALLAGHERAFATILDANLTTLLTAGILIWFGTGPIKGFGVVLAIGIFATMFCALVVSRVILECLIYTNTLKNAFKFCLFKETKINFLKYQKPAFWGSILIVIIGLLSVWFKGDKIYSIDFLGGDEMTVEFVKKLDIGQIERVAKEKNLGEVMPVYQKLLGQNKEILKIQIQGGNSRIVMDALKTAYPEAQLKLVGETSIGATVGSHVKWNAFWSIILALLGILIYVAVRFEIGYGIGAMISTIHDVLMTIGLYVLMGKQFSAPMVAAVLMIIGYSINDTIVVFDRIREELQVNPFMKLGDVINLSVNRTLSRTILTSTTTLISALGLYFFGSGAIEDYALIFVIGIITGTFSSIFIASPIFFWWHKGERRHVEEKHDLLPKYEWDAGNK